MTLLRATAVFLLLVPVRFYQLVIGPLLPKMCRYEPSCSEYFIQAVHLHGPVRGALKGVWRLCRCNPWSMGGIDPP
jgi:putative membrane protein insertion efficiency factor